jgi:hypothetical protein
VALTAGAGSLSVEAGAIKEILVREASEWKQTCVPLLVLVLGF